jgi:signal peptidase I
MIEKIDKQPKKRLLITGFGVFLLFLLAIAIFFYKSFWTISVQGPSMEPTLDNGDRLLITKAYWLVGSIQKNDIVVAHRPGSDEIIIKRVLALGGERVEYSLQPKAHSIAEGPYIVPAGHVYLIGDNRPVSEDSQVFGAVPLENVIGKVVVTNRQGPAE